MKIDLGTGVSDILISTELSEAPGKKKQGRACNSGGEGMNEERDKQRTNKLEINASI